MLKRAAIYRGLVVVLALVVAAVIAAPLYAHCGKCKTSGDIQAKALGDSKMTLAAAATLAEVATKGTAVRAACHEHGDGLVVVVHCMVEGKIVAVEVDGKTGDVKKKTDAKSLEDEGA
jgi:hypothetical protein